MADSDSSLPFYKLLAMDLSSQIILAAIVVVLLVIIFIIVLHHYSKRYWTRRSETSITQTSVSLNLGLEPSVIKSLPIFTFNFDQFKDGLECSVCLCELSLGDKVRLLPKCNHGFHLDCIDMWFQSHSTCPLCRNPISPESSSSSSSNPSLESPSQEISTSGLPPNYPTNILFWGNQTQISEGSSSSSSFSVSSSSSSLSSKRVDKTLVIELPNRVTDSFSLSSSSPPSTSRFSEEQLKPSMSTRLRSLRKLLGGEKRIVPHSSSIVDIEQGEEGRRVQQNSKISSNFRSCYTNSSSNGIYPSEDMNT